MLQEHGEKDPKESGSQHTDLFHSALDVECFRHVAVKSIGAVHIAVKGLQEAKKLNPFTPKI